MSNFTRFNHKSLINPNYQDSEQYIPLKDIPFKKSAELYAAYPEMTYFIKAMYPPPVITVTRLSLLLSLSMLIGRKKIQRFRLS